MSSINNEKNVMTSLDQILDTISVLVEQESSEDSQALLCSLASVLLNNSCALKERYLATAEPDLVSFHEDICDDMESIQDALST